MVRTRNSFAARFAQKWSPVEAEGVGPRAMPSLAKRRFLLETKKECPQIRIFYHFLFLFYLRRDCSKIIQEKKKEARIEVGTEVDIVDSREEPST